MSTETQKFRVAIYRARNGGTYSKVAIRTEDLEAASPQAAAAAVYASLPSRPGRRFAVACVANLTTGEVIS